MTTRSVVNGLRLLKAVSGHWERHVEYGGTTPLWFGLVMQQ